MDSKLISRTISLTRKHISEGKDGCLYYNEESDKTLIQEIVASLSEPDKHIMRGSSFVKEEFLNRIQEITIPVMQQNGEPKEELAIFYKIEDGKLVRRSVEELKAYFANTSQDQIIKDIVDIAKVVTTDATLVDYFKEHKKPNTHKKQAPKLSLTTVRTAKNISIDNLDEQYINPLLDKINEETLRYLSPNQEPEETKKQLRVFIKNYVIEMFDDKKAEQTEFKKENGIEGQQMFMVLGSAGSGKSSTIKHIEQQQCALHLVSDDIKASLAVSFGVSVNGGIIHALGGSILKAVVMPCSMDNQMDVILEKVGDERHKIKELAETYHNRGYSVSMSCIHVDVNECRLRNAARAINFMRDGEPPRMVGDEVLKVMGINPLITYLTLMEEDQQKPESERLFVGGECLSNQLGRTKSPHPMQTLSYGNMRNEQGVKAYQSSALEQRKQLVEALINSFKVKNPNLTADEVYALMEYGNQLIFGNDVINVQNESYAKLLCMLRSMYKSACAELFKPSGALMQSTQENPDVETFKNPQPDYIRQIADSYCDKNNYRYQQCLASAERHYKKIINITV